jgi:heme-degrading monooxygenase HmoA
MLATQSPKARRTLTRFAGLLCGLAVAVLAMTTLPSCEVATPFRGPGYARPDGVILPGAGPTVWVAVTYAVLDNSSRGTFDDYSRKVVESLPQNDGYIGHSVRAKLLGNKMWTMTVWRDEPSLNSFVRSPLHREAVRKGLGGVLRGKFLRFEHPTDAAPPSWDEVLAQMHAIEYIEYGSANAEPAGSR